VVQPTPGSHTGSVGEWEKGEERATERFVSVGGLNAGR